MPKNKTEKQTFSPKRNKPNKHEVQYFNKVYKAHCDIVMGLSMNTRGLLLTFIYYLDKTDNSVRYDGNHISAKEILLITSMAKNTLQASMKELEINKIILIEGGNRNRKIFLNPLFVEDNTTDKSIHEKFKKL